MDCCFFSLSSAQRQREEKEKQCGKQIKPLHQTTIAAATLLTPSISPKLVSATAFIFF